MRVVVTGGGGYVGYHVGWALSQGGHHVILLDVTPPDPIWVNTAPDALWDSLPKGYWGKEEVEAGPLEFAEADITNEDNLLKYLQGCAAVIHTASYGLSGVQQLRPHWGLQEKVNVGGTQAVINAAVRSKVRVIVYTSSYNVVFGGKEILEGDEGIPNFPLYDHLDHYSRTKAIAEMLILMANGKCLGMQEKVSTPNGYIHRSSSSSSAISSSSDSPPSQKSPSPSADSSSLPTHSTLRTCCLRLAGVLGLGERRHTDRLIETLKVGMFVATFGNKDNRVDFVGIQNVVQAHVKALMSLLQEQSQSGSKATALTPQPSLPTISSDTDSHTPSSVEHCDQPENNKVAPSECLPGSSQSVSGNAFFISDGAPISHFEYFRPWFDGLGYTFPSVKVPLVAILAFAYVQEAIYKMTYKFFPLNPFVTPAEAYKCSVVHFFSCKKAEKGFGYRPTRPNDHSPAIDYYRKRGYHKNDMKSSFSWIKFIVASVIISILLLKLLIPFCMM